ncbi:hypothetical protein TWF106_000558 [Orbilia oligospora]|uniref:F-box domain-containing protein n=1 Tax=Orbilia oligospora TaxID=2813651 RepID=A0A6G1MH35_ORBOL|nr:hypothetical protein TWF788_002993 [Orbilia oligospora]KAF3206852.1 hypothetical protein TWF106_000558 [Orbilia oligospora]KAF3212558.1 hypothetical protein TWF679_005748 [Orbilia oligospora]KAF3213672.1 hypothetical protein TWF191_009971 [Orbilia oligospora]KAF3258233.1 hypothetical protein TWF192_000368 [Orbilia oligospora]
MAPITSLPSEVLLDIFHRVGSNWTYPERDANADIIHIRQVNRKWRVLGQDVPLTNFWIDVDGVTQSLWKLGRSLLHDVSIAAQIEEIWVRWSRRKADYPETFTKRWKWKREDRERIELYREELAAYISPATFDAILEGVNSEALLPFIFCFTTNLKELRLGRVEALLVARVWFANGAGAQNIRESLGPGLGEEVFKYIEDEVDGEEYIYDYDDRPDDFYQTDIFFAKHMPPEAEEEGALWFHVNMGTPGKYLPGLRKVTHLENRYTEHQFFLSDLSGWSARYIAPLLLLPSLETLEIECHATIGGRRDKLHYPLYIPFEPYRGLKSKVKQLNLIDGRMRLEDYDAIASITENLEYLQIYHSDVHNELSDKDLAYIAASFRLYNEHTLALNQIFINDLPGTEMEGVE